MVGSKRTLVLDWCLLQSPANSSREFTQTLSMPGIVVVGGSQVHSILHLSHFYCLCKEGGREGCKVGGREAVERGREAVEGGTILNGLRI